MVFVSKNVRNPTNFPKKQMLLINFNDYFIDLLWYNCLNKKGFSMPDTQILKDELFEKHKLYDVDSRLHKTIGKKIHDVFARLFKNTNINLDDFYFTAFDSDTPNAFMIDKANTQTHKYVIAVSYGLIKAVSRTEEFAAIIAHECGHVIWAELIGGENTIIQERSADIHSVDMMMNAGYNPRYVTVAQKKIFSHYSKNDDVSFDVHGNEYQRINDVKAYMTKIASEQGDFPSIENDAPDADWINFQNDVEKIHNEDGYDTFLEKQLKKKFNTKDLSKLDRLEVLKFLLEYINSSDTLSNRTRAVDLTTKLTQYDYSTKSDDEIKILQDIFIALSKHRSYFDTYEINHVLRKFRLDRFGPFQEQYENIENFIKYYDNEQKAIFYAQKICNLLWTVEYRADLNNSEYPFFEPLKEQNVGKMLPWKRLLSYQNADINLIFHYLCEDHIPSGGSWYSWIHNYNSKDYFCDENDIVIAYGEEAHRLYEERERKHLQKEFNSHLKTHTDCIHEIITCFENMIKYANGETNYEDFITSVNHAGPEYINDDFITMFLGYYNRISAFGDLYDKVDKYKLDYSAYFDFIDEIKNTNFYKKFILNTPEFALYPDFTTAPGVDYNYLLSRIRFLLNPVNFKKFNDFVMESLLTLFDDMTKSGQYIQKASYMYENLINSSVHFLNTRFDEKFLQNHDEKVSLFDKRAIACEEIRNQRIQQIIPKIIEHSVNNCDVSTRLPRFLPPVVHTELQSQAPSKLIENMMKSIGISSMPSNNNDLMLVLQYMTNSNKEDYTSNYHLRVLGNQAADHIGGNLISDEISSYIRSVLRPNANNITQLMYYLLAEYMRCGYKLDPIQMISYFENRKNENFSDEVCDIFGKYVTVDVFKPLSMLEKIELFEFMDMRNLFSEKIANKNKFIKIITDEVLQHKDTEFVAREIVLKILTRRCVTKYGKPMSDNDFEFADERERFIEFYAQYWAKKLGHDDGSDEYLERVKKFTDFVTSTTKIKDKYSYRNEMTEVRVFSKMIAEKLLDNVSNKVLAQERAAKMFGDAAKLRINGEKINSYDYYGRGAEAAFAILARKPARALATIKFLNKKISDESVQRLIDTCTEDSSDLQNSGFTSVINKQTLTIIHENFWNGDLPIRAYVMNRLLGAYTQDENKKLQLVIDTYFKPDSEYYNDAKIVLESVYKNLQDYERGLILSALLSSGQNDDASSMTNGQQVGRGLKMFFQAKGGAFVKFGQLLSYLPTLDSDIRKELASLREKANIPTRDELFNMLQTSLPEAEYKKISYVGKILGGGSIYVSVAVKYDGQDCVIALMRPHTRELMHDGIEMISNSINDMAMRDKKFKQLKNIVTQAKLSCESEVDIKQDYEKYQRAVKTYESLRVHTPSADYSPDVARWINYGATETGDNAFKIMEMAPGGSLISGEMDENEKHDMAMAYVALELTILLSGARWDTDRHAGQQNFYNKDFRDFCIGIFDTGAQMNADPVQRDKIMLGHLLYELIRGVRGGKKIADVLNNKIKTLDSVGKTFGFDTVYIDGVQRGLIALSDIIEYQKEIKDADGNIIQERRTLSESDLQNIIIAVLDSGVIDKTVKKTITAKALLNKLRILRPGWFKTLGEGINMTPSDISVEYTGETPEVSHITLLNKARAEIEKLIAKKRATQHLGIDKGLITKSDDNPDLVPFGELVRI